MVDLDFLGEHVFAVDQITVHENALFRRWKRKRKLPFVKDGVPFPAIYKDSSIRTIFVLREANHGTNPKSEDLRLLLQTTSHRFWLQKMSPWCHGLTHYALNTTRSWNQTRAKDFNPSTALQPFGFMQIKKIPGRANAIHREVKRFAEEDISLIRKQLSIYSPTVIIACGLGTGNIFDLLLKTVFLESEKQILTLTKRNRRRYAKIIDAEVNKEPFYLIENYHPSSRGTRFRIYKELIATFRQVMSRTATQRM